MPNSNRNPNPFFLPTVLKDLNSNGTTMGRGRKKIQRAPFRLGPENNRVVEESAGSTPKYSIEGVDDLMRRFVYREILKISIRKKLILTGFLLLCKHRSGGDSSV